MGKRSGGHADKHFLITHIFSCIFTRICVSSSLSLPQEEEVQAVLKFGLMPLETMVGVKITLGFSPGHFQKRIALSFWSLLLNIKLHGLLDEQGKVGVPGFEAFPEARIL